MWVSAPTALSSAAIILFLTFMTLIKISARIAGAGSSLEIGEGSLLGFGSVIQMNVQLGKHVIVVSNSVVKRSFPSYCVVDGHPATVVLKYNEEDERWTRPSIKS